MPYKDPKKQREYARRYYVENNGMLRERRRTYHLRNRYGITESDVDELKVRQKYMCMICKKTVARLDVDHCHATGRVRALLCRGCNAAIGYAGENSARLRAMADYVEHHAEISSLIGPLPKKSIE
jgi:coenzyme F420-reducing hydrogenase gamma subunit